MSSLPPRVSAAPVDPMFLDRWSPRAFSAEPVERDLLASLFEAARWAPSCFNEQPWLFLYARTPEHLETFRSLLVEGNEWAKSAPVLSIVFGRRAFAKTGKPNRWHGFDCGAAWVSLAFEARKLGLYTHGMAGFDEDKAYELLRVPKTDYEAMAAIAIGHRGDSSLLPESKRAQEHPNGRKEPREVAKEGPLGP